MKTVQKLLLILVALIPALVSAQDFDIPKFGEFGISYLSDVDYYKEYVGSVVKYIPEGKTGSAKDKKYFVDKGGKYNTEYTIIRVSNIYKKTILTLQENGTKNKVKFEFSNSKQDADDRFYLDVDDRRITLPLFFFNDFEKRVNEYKGKEKNNTVISDLFMFEQDNKYPIPTMIVTDKTDEQTYISFPMESYEYLKIGDVYTDPKFKCIYTIVGIKYKIKRISVISNRLALYYVLKNSITGETKEIDYTEAKTKAFEGDDAGKFLATLQKIEVPSDSEIRYGETKEITDEGMTKFSYTDNFIDIIIFPLENQFNFVIRNVSDNSIKIVWNEAVFVDVDGSTSKIMHSGIKYSEREGDQPSSTIIKGAKLDDIAVPTQNVYYSEYLKEWITQSLYKNADMKKEDQTIKLMIPIQVKDVINEYIFEFGIKYKLEHPELLAE